MAYEIHSAQDDSENYDFTGTQYFTGGWDDRQYVCLIFIKLKNIDFQKDSKLQKICESAFWGCTKLKEIIFPPNSELRIIEKSAFNLSFIETITIPSHVTQICESAFSSCTKLNEIIFSPNSELQIIEKSAFAGSSIEKITKQIPENMPHLLTKIHSIIRSYYPYTLSSQFDDFLTSFIFYSSKNHAYTFEKVSSIRVAIDFKNKKINLSNIHNYTTLKNFLQVLFYF